MLNEIRRVLGKQFRKCLYFTYREIYLEPIPTKVFSRFLFIFGVIIFVFLIGFQYWLSVVDYPQPMSGKPNFHLVVAVPFAFEFTLLLVGIILFIRFLAVNFSLQLNIPKGVLNEAKSLNEKDFLLVVPDELCFSVTQFLENSKEQYLVKKVEE
mgnify:CR=1 FL=1